MSPRRIVTNQMKAQIVEMAQAGSSVHDIWISINREVQKGYIGVLISQARSLGADIPYRKPGFSRRVSIKPPSLVFTCKLSGHAGKLLGEEAERRGLNITNIAAQILETVANDGIINAVLDDA